MAEDRFDICFHCCCGIIVLIKGFLDFLDVQRRTWKSHSRSWTRCFPSSRSPTHCHRWNQKVRLKDINLKMMATWAWMDDGKNMNDMLIIYRGLFAHRSEEENKSWREESKWKDFPRLVQRQRTIKSVLWRLLKRLDSVTKAHKFNGDKKSSVG